MANCRNSLDFISLCIYYTMFIAVIATENDYHDLNYTEGYKNSNNSPPMKYDYDYLRNRNICFINGTEYNADDILKENINGCRDWCNCTHGTDDTTMPLLKPKRPRRRGPKNEMLVALRRQLKTTGPVECCPTIEEITEPNFTENRDGTRVKVYRDPEVNQQFFEYSCKSDVVDKPCRCVGEKFNNQSKCVQKYSYVSAIVNKIYGLTPDEDSKDTSIIDYIKVRSGCGCEIIPTRKQIAMSNVTRGNYVTRKPATMKLSRPFQDYHDLNYTKDYENNSNGPPTKSDYNYLRNRNILCFINGTEYNADDILKENINGCRDWCNCTHGTDDTAMPLKKPTSRRKPKNKMMATLRQEAKNGPVACCPTKTIQTRPYRSLNRYNISVQIYQSPEMIQTFYEHYCQPNVVDKPCRCAAQMFDTECVQQFSYLSAAVYEYEMTSPDGTEDPPRLTLDYIKVRSGCACEITSKRKKNKCKPTTENALNTDYVTEDPTMTTLLSTITDVTVDTELPVPANLLKKPDNCDKMRCRGPVGHYKDLNCTAEYENVDDCCPVRYNCDHLKVRSRNKCLVNGHEYEIGEKLREEDTNRCEENCICTNQTNGIPDFNCTSMMNITCPVYIPPRSPLCYLVDSLQHCCQLDAICSEDPNNRTICIVDKKIYRSGDFFVPLEKPHLSCMCRPGYKGDYIEPFCFEQNRLFWSDLHAVYNYYSNSIPIYPAIDEERVVVSNNIENWVSELPDNYYRHYGLYERDYSVEPYHKDVCPYFFKEMVIGESIIISSYSLEVCYYCYCDVPPIPTCIPTRATPCPFGVLDLETSSFPY